MLNTLSYLFVSCLISFLRSWAPRVAVDKKVPTSPHSRLIIQPPNLPIISPWPDPILPRRKHAFRIKFILDPVIEFHLRIIVLVVRFCDLFLVGLFPPSPFPFSSLPLLSPFHPPPKINPNTQEVEGLKERKWLAYLIHNRQMRSILPPIHVPHNPLSKCE
jgi:hypothetical protein